MNCEKNQTPNCCCSDCRPDLLICDDLVGTSTEDAPKTHKQKMLEELHEAEAWHERYATSFSLRETKEMHRRYQQAIWWALEQLDDEAVLLSVE